MSPWGDWFVGSGDLDATVASDGRGGAKVGTCARREPGWTIGDRATCGRSLPGRSVAITSSPRGAIGLELPNPSARSVREKRPAFATGEGRGARGWFWRVGGGARSAGASRSDPWPA